MESMHAFEQAVLGTIRAYGAIAPGDRVLVGVSGGADSTALLAALEALADRLDVTLAVAHLNHRLRGAASERDAAFVAELAARLALPCFVGASDVLAGVRSNREAAAREERHGFLWRTAREWGATRVALAHTRDDQAETLLLRLARGAGPASLGGMRVVRDDGLVRPLLEQPRSACVAYLGVRGIGWVEDESNADEAFFRNRIRHRLLPLVEAELGVDVRARLARLAAQLNEESALAEQRLDDLLREPVRDRALPIDVLRHAGAGAPRLVHAWLARCGVRATGKQIAMLRQVAASAEPSGEVALGGGWRVRRCYAELRLAPAHDADPAPAAATELDVPGSAVIPGWCVRTDLADHVPAPPGVADGRVVRSCLDRDRLHAPLWIRGPRPGDRVRLAYGRRKLADILIDAKIPRHERAGLAVIGCGADVLWVPGVVRSVLADPSATTRRCVIVLAERTGTVE